MVRYVQSLTDDHSERLEQTMKAATSCRVRARAQSLLLSDQGTTIKDMATTSQVDRDTVSSWITPWEHPGAQSFHDTPRSGRPSTLTPDEPARAQHYSKEEPRALQGVGERFATKTAKRLRIASLKRLAKKARLRGKRVRKSGKRRREPEACARGQRALEALQHQEDTGKIALYYLDASGCALEPTRPSAGQEPHRVLERPAMRDGRINVGGCMHRQNDLPTSMFEQSIPTGVVSACFEAFCHTIKKKMVVVIDHASIHRSEAFADPLPAWKKQGLIMKYLSPYAPALHLIAILWRRITYTWLPFSAYACGNALSEALEAILSKVGAEYQITFA